MNPFDQSAPKYLENRALLLLLVSVSLALGWILLPFYSAILWGAIIALLFEPVHRRLLQRLSQRRTPAALLTLLIVLLVVVLPFALVTAALAREAAHIYQRLQSGELDVALYLRGVFAALPDSMTALLGRFGLADFDILQGKLAAAVAQATQFIATQALSIGHDTFAFAVRVVITLYLAFFLIRDGDRVLSAVRRMIPLAPAHTQELIGKFTTVIRATVKGNLLVAIVQGALGGIAFWLLGVGGAVLWAVLMAFLSLVPVVGSGLVWLPVAVYLLVSGAVWQGIALIAFGALVIGLVDNVLRPLLVGKDTRMPDYVVLITTLGGLEAFGINGLVVGPTIAAMFIAVWHIYLRMRPDAVP
jgi:predicted PurR-regulated permease PerM